MKNLVYFLVLLTGNLLAQEWTWDTVINSRNKIMFCQDHDHGFYTFENRGDIIRKYDAQKNILWEKQYAGLHIFKVSCNSNSGLFITGEFENTVNLQDHFILQSRGKSDVFYANLDPNSGKILFLNTIASAESDYAGDISCEHELIVSCTTGGDTYIAGSVFPKRKNQDIVIARFSLDYVFLDCRMSAVGSDADLEQNAYAIEHETDEMGNIWLLAGINGTFNFGGRVLKDFDATYLMKLNHELDLQITRRMENDAYSEVNNLTVDGAGSIYCVKNYLYEFGASSTVMKINTTDGSTTGEYSPEMNCNMHRILATSEGHILFTGMRIRWAFIGRLPIKYYMTTGELTHEMRVLWIRQDSSANYLSGTDLFAMDNDYLMVSGTFSETLHLASDRQAPDFNQFMAVLKFPHDSLIESVTERSSDAGIQIYPNPSSGKFSVSGLSQQNGVNVFDVSGKCIYKRRNLEESCIDLGDAKAGYYFLEAKDREKLIRKKIIIE